MENKGSPQSNPEAGTDSQGRSQTVTQVIEAFVKLVMLQKFADMPGWLDSDLTVSQVRAIYFLMAYERLTISDLARLLDLGKPAASVLVQQLVEGRLVERSEDPVDRRRSWVSLTALGAELVNGRRERRENKFREWLGQMSDDDLQCLLRGVTALGQRLEEDPIRPQVEFLPSSR